MDARAQYAHSKVALGSNWGRIWNRDQQLQKEKQWQSHHPVVPNCRLCFSSKIGDSLRAKEACNFLKEMPTKLVHIINLLQLFSDIEIKANDNIQSYLGWLIDLHQKLSNGSYAFADSEKM